MPLLNFLLHGLRVRWLVAIIAKPVVGFVELSSSQPNASLAVGGDGANSLEDFPQPSFFLLPYNLNLRSQLFQELNLSCWQAWLPATKIFSQESSVDN